jgi:hypothetical protein
MNVKRVCIGLKYQVVGHCTKVFLLPCLRTPRTNVALSRKTCSPYAELSSKTLSVLHRGRSRTSSIGQWEQRSTGLIFMVIVHAVSVRDLREAVDICSRKYYERKPGNKTMSLPVSSTFQASKKSTLFRSLNHSSHIYLKSNPPYEQDMIWNQEAVKLYVNARINFTSLQYKGNVHDKGKDNSRYK